MRTGAGIVLNGVGLILFAVGLVSCVALIPAVVFGEWFSFFGMLLSVTFYVCIGLALHLTFKELPGPNLRQGMVVASFGWLLVALLGALPFILILGPESGGFWNAFFESMSGWTATGLSVYPHPENLPGTLQFWRSLMEWVGGGGVILLTLALVGQPGVEAYSLYRSEAREEKIRSSVHSTVKTIWWIYLVYTGLGIALFYSAGMPLWHAINNGMTGIATGGFSPVSDSFSGYDNIWIEIAAIPIMTLGAISFASHYQLFNGKFKKFFSDPQTKALLVLFLAGSMFVFIENLGPVHLNYSVKETGRYSAFQFISALTTTGFQTADIFKWEEIPKVALSLAMIVGGCAGSTVGGIKLFRVILLTKGVGWRLRRMLAPPHAIYRYKIGKKTLTPEEANDAVGEAASLSFLWVICLLIGIMIIHNSIAGLEGFQQFRLVDILLEVCSAQGNVGLSVGIVGPDLPAVAKLMLIINMWIGRLEIIPILIMIWSSIKPHKAP